MNIKISFTLFLLIMSLALPTLSQAARPLGPPIAEFLSERNRTAEGKVVKKHFGLKVEMHIDEYLAQKDEDRIILSVDRDVFADLEVGETYIFVFSRMRKNELYRDAWEVNPNGPSLVKVRGVGTPAIYQRNEGLHALLTPADKRESFIPPDEETAFLLTLSDSDSDPRARELAVLELALRPDLQEQISIDNAERFAAIASASNIRLRTFLLRAALRFPEQRRAGWLEREWRRAALEAGTNLDLNSFEPLLVKISMEGLRDHGDEEDVEMISKHLEANNPGVAKAALEALDAINPGVALSRVKEIMQQEQDMHMSTRQAFTQYINAHSGA